MTDDQLELTLGAYDLGSWGLAREALGFNGGGPNPVDGVELVEEQTHGESDSDYQSVTLAYEDEDAFDRAQERLLDKADALYEAGAGKEGENLRKVATALMRTYEEDEYGP